MTDIFQVGKARPDEPELKQPAHAGVIPKVNFRWILSGPSKSGKSNLARWSLDKYYNDGRGKSWFDEIYLLSPTANIDYCWADLKGLKPKNRITNPTPELLLKILNSQKKDIQGTASDVGAQRMSSTQLSKRKQKAKKILIIFDDAIAESKMINSKEFLKVFVAGRHYGISSMVMTQSYVKIPRSVRLQATHVAMFPSRASEIQRLYNEHGPKELSKNDFTELVQYATQPNDVDPFPFLYVDCFAPAKTRFRRGFTNVLEINDGGEGGVGEEEEEEEEGKKRKKSRKRRNVGSEDIYTSSRKRKKNLKKNLRKI